jgi:hypothetical protein
VNTEPITLTEPDFCARYGLDREDIKQIRKESLVKDEDWSWTPGEAVKLSRTGLEKLSSLLGIQITEIKEKGSIAKIKLASPTNRKLLIADLEGEEIRIRVQTNARFVPGMNLKVKKDPNGLPIYYADQPLPRFKGKY